MTLKQVDAKIRRILRDDLPKGAKHCFDCTPVALDYALFLAGMAAAEKVVDEDYNDDYRGARNAWQNGHDSHKDAIRDEAKRLRKESRNDR